MQLMYKNQDQFSIDNVNQRGIILQRRKESFAHKISPLHERMNLTL